MTRLEKLIGIYKEAYQRVLKQLGEAKIHGRWTGTWEQMRMEIEKAVRDLDAAAVKHGPFIARDGYMAGLEAAKKVLPSSSFAGINRLSVQLIAENLVDSLVDANHYFGRQTQDRIREIGLEAAAQKLSTGETTKEIQRRIVEQLTEEGLIGHVDARGRNIRLDSYAEMVSRTTLREATNTATVESTRSFGYDLVKMTTHYPTCAICAPLQGRVYSISGNDERFPALDDLPGFDKGFKTIHPNCRHVVTPTIEDGWSDAEREKHLQDAKTPLEGDIRDKAEVDLYNDQRASQAARWRDRRQYERYKAALETTRLRTSAGSVA